MKTVADKTAKRLSAEDWFARYDFAASPSARVAPPRQRPPADRVAVRS
jgi:hypothetical protein